MLKIVKRPCSSYQSHVCYTVGHVEVLCCYFEGQVEFLIFYIVDHTMGRYSCSVDCVEDLSVEMSH